MCTVYARNQGFFSFVLIESVVIFLFTFSSVFIFRARMDEELSKHFIYP